MAIKGFYALVKQTVTNWLDDYAPSMGAAIAFYTVFSLAPLLIIVIGIAGFFWGHEAAQGQLLEQVSALVGAEGGKAVESVVLGAQEPAQGIAATVISVVVLMVGATTVFSELQSALDRIWKVNAKKQSGIWALIRARLLSFGLILTLAFLLLVSLVVSLNPAIMQVLLASTSVLVAAHLTKKTQCSRGVRSMLFLPNLYVLLQFIFSSTCHYT